MKKIKIKISKEELRKRLDIKDGERGEKGEKGET